MNDTTAWVAGAATTIGGLLASIPLERVNEVLQMLSLLVSITVGFYTVRKLRKLLQ